MRRYLAIDAVLSNAEASTRMAHDCRGACVKRLFSLLGGWHNRRYNFVEPGFRSRLILPPHVAWQNIQLGAVLGHGAPGDRDAALPENLDDLVIA
jgi:hypothetical protein